PTPTPVPIPTSLYRVERGDTLQAIAIKFGVTVEEIVALNELKNASMIVIGQELMIPRKSTRR
ncbi:MAG: LysM peptidoglycan-binding domain-containing protein, partial [Chloroflexi bacterium]|nr:LysM peptidoglycan-binding domain-containing protein [Chloroflexota bacterium]